MSAWARGGHGAWLAAGLLLALAAPAGAAEKSGKAWVAKFPGSTKVDDLEPVFRPKVEAFIAAAKAGGASVRITSTLRPKQRAYLMHWSWLIAKKGHAADKVPAMAGVDIDWWHGSQAASAQKAQEMVEGYG